MGSVVASYIRSSIEALFGKEGTKERVMGELTAEQHETLRLHFYEGIRWQKLARNSGSPREMCGIILSGDRKTPQASARKPIAESLTGIGTYWG